MSQDKHISVFQILYSCFLQSKPEIGTFGEKPGKCVHLFNTNFTSTFKERNWHKPEGTVIEVVLQVVVFQQSTY